MFDDKMMVDFVDRVWYEKKNFKPRHTDDYLLLVANLFGWYWIEISKKMKRFWHISQKIIGAETHEEVILLFTNQNLMPALSEARHIA